MFAHRSSALIVIVAGAAIATSSACHQAVPAPAHPVAARLSTADSARAAKRHADSVRQAANQRASLALKARDDSIRLHQDTLRVAVAAARKTLFASVHFDDGSAAIRPADQATLDRKAAIIAKNPALRLRVFGFSNDRGSPDATQQLAAQRAAAVRQYLIAHGADSTRVSALAFGSARALCTKSKDDTCEAQNRRDEFVILDGGGDITP